jgi:3-oxoacyl-[acyl-carrier-protein] synthase III
MMAGIRSIGWWIPEGRRLAQDIAKDHGVAEEALAKLGLVEKPVAGKEDHPSTMGARATRAALEAAGLGTDELDLLIYAGVTKDWPAPWVAAFGVLHELGSTRAAGFDLMGRCAGGIDALWLAKTLVESGTYRTVAVCCAERYDYLLGPQRPVEVISDAAYSAGAATVIVSAEAGNDIVAFSNLTNPDLSVHKAGGPRAGGSRRPVDESALREQLHMWQGQLSIREVDSIARYSADADRHNYPRLLKQAGFEAVDFVVCSPMYPAPQLEVLKELGVDPKATLFTIPFLGHIGPADLFLILGVAIASGRQVGRRIVMSTRTTVYSNALAIRSKGEEPGIRVAGTGLDVGRWSSASGTEVES